MPEQLKEKKNGLGFQKILKDDRNQRIPYFQGEFQGDYHDDGLVDSLCSTFRLCEDLHMTFSLL